MEQQQQQESPTVKSSPYQSPMWHYGSSIITLTNPKSSLHDLELTYRGVRETEGNKFIVVGKPLMNEEGINNVIGLIQSIVNQVTILGNFNKEEVPQVLEFLADTLAKDLMMNRKDYGISDSTARDKIFFSAITTSFITMKRAFEEGDRRFWKGSVQEVKTTIDSPNRGKKGFLSFMNPWSK